MSQQKTTYECTTETKTYAEAEEQARAMARAFFGDTAQIWVTRSDTWQENHYVRAVGGPKHTIKEAVRVAWEFQAEVY